jgi:hypothetical protein
MIKQIPRRSDYQPLKVPALLFFGLTAVCLLVLLIQGALGDTSLDILFAPITWLVSLDTQTALDTLSSAAEVVAAVLAIAITVVAIVVELAATRYSHQITRLFLREPVNLAVLGIFVVTTVQCIWVAAVMDNSGPQALLPHAGFAVTLVLVTLCLLLLIPYIYFVFAFLSPISVIDKICRDAYNTVLKARTSKIKRNQARVEEAIDELQDVARSAIQQSDRGIAIAAVNAMTGFVTDYVQIRDDLPVEWFDMSQGVAEDPDFVALAPETIASIETQGIWVERKVFRRYLSLMGQAAMRERDVANLIGINTQRIATGLSGNKPWLLELCINVFNSYLRETINAGDQRTAYYLMNQYRLIAEWLLTTGQGAKCEEIADYLRIYGQYAHNTGASFLLESAAFYVMRLVEKALQEKSESVDALLDCLLNLDIEIKEENVELQETSLLGVRRAQVQMATLFLMRGDEERARRIARDLHGERIERLERLRQIMLADEREQFWELSDLGVNFQYLPAERRPYFDRLFELVRENH